MTSTRQVFELARRDFVQRAKSRAFLMTMVLTVGLVLLIGPLLSLGMRDPEPTRIGITGDLPAGTAGAIEDQATLLDMEVVIEQYPDLASVEAAVVAGSIEVAIDGLDDIIFGEEVDTRLAALVIGGVATAQRQLLAAEMGITPDEFTDLLYPVDYRQRTLEPAETEEDRAREAGALVGLLLLYMSILLFGQFVMMGVMEEKQTRVVEVVLSRVQPYQVLIGKVVGIGLLGLVQIVALGAAVIFTMRAVDVADIDVTGIGLRVIGALVLWYLLGYTFYSFMYGALGATISRQEDMQGAAMIPVLLILPGFFVGQIALMNPEGWTARVMSFVPVWSPMVMAVRATVADVPVWEIAVSIALIVVTTFGLIRLGGRIYRGAILQRGRTRLRAAWRAAR
jgi:ABC-2 type transport system permease protein